MPTYQYVCTACATPHEAVQAFTDPPLSECPVCGGQLRKVFSSVGVVFKGSGFYRNDSRTPPRSDGDGSKASDKPSDGKAGKGGADGKPGTGSAGGTGSKGGTDGKSAGTDGKSASDTSSASSRQTTGSGSRSPKAPKSDSAA